MEYLPARMLNEFVYCPRLFYYEWVEKLFAHNVETIEGANRHARLDSKTDALPDADDAARQQETIHSRSVMLTSDVYGIIARIDLVEGEGRHVSPVDYKRGAPAGRGPDGELQAWDSDRVQVAAQSLILRENGYLVDEAIVYYCKTKQRVRVHIDDELINWTIEQIQAARRAADGPIPPPLVHSPKCPRCSLVGICLPDETHHCRQRRFARRRNQRTLFEIEELPDLPDATADLNDAAPDDIRRLIPARDDLRPLYLSTQGTSVGVSGNVLKVKEKGKLVQEVRIFDVSQVNVFGAIQLTTQAIQTLCQNETPILYFSFGGWFYGITQGIGLKNIFLRREQFRLADSPLLCLRFARALVAGKIRNQRTMLMRNHVEPPRRDIIQLKHLSQQAERADSLERLLGLEGTAARLYFQNFGGMIKAGDPEDQVTGQPVADFQKFDFDNRNRRPPRDPVNALLSFGYSLLVKDVTIACAAVGFDPYLGFYHQLRFGRPALALDLMEPFRPLIVDSAVLTAINTRMVTPRHFIRVGNSVSMTPDGRKAFIRAYEQRMDSLVTHPIFGYRINYRRMLEVQTRLLARLIMGETTQYPVFVTR